MSETKLCPQCNLVLSISEFNRHKTSKDRLQYKCKKCNSQIGKEWNERNKEQLQTNCKNWYKANRNKQIQNSSAWNKENEEHRKQVSRKRYEANRDQELQRNKEWRQANPHYQRDRSKIDINFKLAYSIRHRLRRAIKERGGYGSGVKNLGCSIEELRSYLESKFLPGMTWNNWGTTGWHIDHILPLASFDLSDEAQVKKACHYTNLQPLWAIDNLKKGDKIL